MGPPAVAGGRVYVPTTGHERTALWAFDATTGQLIYRAPFEGQWPHTMPPTIHGSQVYVGAGYYGGVTYAFDAAQGQRLWTASASGVWDMFTPAADGDHVYHHSGEALHVFSPSSGQTLATISDPFGTTSHYQYHGAPVIGSRGNVIAFASGAFSGMASSNIEHYQPRVLSSFDIATRRRVWTTQHSYITAPAVAGGTIYAGSNQSPILHALDEATGQLRWSWAVPGNLANESFHRNVIATDNLVFASTSTAVYAIDIATRQHVWSYPQPGMLALSASGYLYIATGAVQSDGGLVAIRVR
jgi:outer membrane protein assembly factor BamB